MKTSSPGYDDIHSKVIKIVSTFISKPLSNIINLSFSSGIVPDKLKIGRVVPVYKGGARLRNPIIIQFLYSLVFQKSLKD